MSRAGTSLRSSPGSTRFPGGALSGWRGHNEGMSHPKQEKRVLSRGYLYLGMVAIALSLYVGSYVALSVRGRYEATVLGLGHVKHRRWMPMGFVTDGDFNRSMHIVFFPLYWLDISFWHTSAKAKSGHYPVNSDDEYLFRNGS